MPKTAYINNTYKPYSELTLHISDLSIHRGYGIFDFMLERNGKVPFIGQYIGRFMTSASLMKLALPYSKEEIEKIIFKLLEQNGFHNSSIKLLLTGGYSEDGFTPGTPNFIIINHAFPVSVHDYKKGESLITVEYQRETPDAKTINYVTSLLHNAEMKAKGAIDVLYHKSGYIFECSRCNIFLVKGQTLITPAKGMLKGITRNNVLTVAKDICKVEERNVALGETKEADEVFMTCTTKDVMPISKIDETFIGKGGVGELTGRIMEIYNSLLTKHG